MSSSAEFREWWPKNEVLCRLSSKKRIQHSIAGRMDFEYMSFAVVDKIDTKLIVYTPLEENQSSEKLKGLLREFHTNARSRATVDRGKVSPVPLRTAR
jgi:hypothetical protein